MGNDEKVTIFFKENRQKFSNEQLAMVRNQLNSFLQLTVQTYSIIKETNGLQDVKTLGWKKELVMSLLT